MALTCIYCFNLIFFNVRVGSDKSGEDERQRATAGGAIVGILGGVSLL